MEASSTRPWLRFLVTFYAARGRQRIRLWWSAFRECLRLVSAPAWSVEDIVLVSLLEVTAPPRMVKAIQEAFGSPEHSPDASQAALLGIDEDIYWVYRDSQRPPGVTPPYSTRASGRKWKRQKPLHRASVWPWAAG